MESTFAPHTGRLDRHVRRSYLRVGEGVSRHRIAYSLEEALRLTSLPGEEEGRIYCFRRVSLSGIPAEANRRVWMEQIQQVLGALAVQAVHASDPSASSANAVYFNNIEEALETLLRKAVRASGARWTTPEWFSNSVSGTEPGESYALQIPAILERLRPPSMAPGAAAAILFAALGGADPVALLSAIPSATLREWVRELEGRKNLSASAPPVQLPGEIKTALQRAASHFGWKDPATVWLAAQAVLCLSPGAWSSGTVAKRTRSTLRMLEEEQPREQVDRSASMIRSASAPPLVFDDDDEIDSTQRLSFEKEETSPAPQNEASLFRPHSIASEVPSSDQAPVDDMAVEAAPPDIELPDILAARPPLLGEATQAAGLYFLLNVLRSLGIVAALETCPALAEANLAPYILRQLAAEASVSDSDPILLGLRLPQAAFALPAEILADLPVQPEAWPNGFTVSRRASFDSPYFLRVWTVAIKRWCWRMGRIAVSDIVNRNGRVWLTRTDLDVTFPLAAADLRIRRIGLDIDPGWLPWFGESGRVVRFHYRDREPEGPSC
jgi:hypothetical protein